MVVVVEVEGPSSIEATAGATYSSNGHLGHFDFIGPKPSGLSYLLPLLSPLPNFAAPRGLYCLAMQSLLDLARLDTQLAHLPWSTLLEINGAYLSAAQQPSCVHRTKDADASGGAHRVAEKPLKGEVKESIPNKCEAQPARHAVQVRAATRPESKK